MGPGFFPANPNLADILGEIDLVLKLLLFDILLILENCYPVKHQTLSINNWLSGLGALTNPPLPHGARPELLGGSRNDPVPWLR